MKKSITQKELKHICNYVDDGSLVWKNPMRKNYKLIGMTLGGVNRDNGYVYAVVVGKKYRLHRLIFLYHYGYFPEFVDHINGIRTDNKIENLRACTQSQNFMNMGKKKCNTSGYKNVRSHKDRDTFTVAIRYSSGTHYKYGFKTPETANLYAIEKRNELHGEFARHN